MPSVLLQLVSKIIVTSKPCLDVRHIQQFLHSRWTHAILRGGHRENRMACSSSRQRFHYTIEYRDCEWVQTIISPSLSTSLNSVPGWTPSFAENHLTDQTRRSQPSGLQGVPSSWRTLSSASRRRISFSVRVGGTMRAMNAPNCPFKQLSKQVLQSLEHFIHTSVHIPPNRSTQATPFLPYSAFSGPPSSSASTMRKIALDTNATCVLVHQRSFTLWTQANTKYVQQTAA